MSQNDAWEQRYAAIVPEKLTPRDATVLLDLIEEDTDRFVEALSALALTYEEEVVYCECAPDVNPNCPLGDHFMGHLVPADWRVSEAGNYGAFAYYCTRCKEAFARRPEAAEYRFEMLGDETHGYGEEDNTDADHHQASGDRGLRASVS